MFSRSQESVGIDRAESISPISIRGVHRADGVDGCHSDALHGGRQSEIGLVRRLAPGSECRMQPHLEERDGVAEEHRDRAASASAIRAVCGFRTRTAPARCEFARERRDGSLFLRPNPSGRHRQRANSCFMRLQVVGWTLTVASQMGACVGLT